jgi:hypothetical protein
MTKRKLFEIGGVIAGAILIAIGAASLFLSVNGFNEVRSTIARENIVGTPDSTIPGQKVDTGAEAKAFADVMRKHTLEATGGQTYAEMGRFLDANGSPTSDEALAATDESGQPVENPLRQMWVTETALTTALNTAYLAERISLWGIVVGTALVLSGAGFMILALGGALRRREEVAPAAPPIVAEAHTA